MLRASSWANWRQSLILAQIGVDLIVKTVIKTVVISSPRTISTSGTGLFAIHNRWWAAVDSNHLPPRYQHGALPVELAAHGLGKRKPGAKRANRNSTMGTNRRSPAAPARWAEPHRDPAPDRLGYIAANVS